MAKKSTAKSLGNTDANGTTKNVGDVVFFGDGTYAIAEALTFVPGALIVENKESGGRRLV